MISDSSGSRKPLYYLASRALSEMKRSGGPFVHVEDVGRDIFDRDCEIISFRFTSGLPLIYIVLLRRYSRDIMHNQGNDKLIG